MTEYPRHCARCDELLGDPSDLVVLLTSKGQEAWMHMVCPKAAVDATIRRPGVSYRRGHER